VLAAVKEALMITAFVFVMMLAVEYLNVFTRGVSLKGLSRGRWRQYGIASLLGATPGCLGAFGSVALYLHGLISVGAVVGCMIATSGDEAFVMLAKFPRQALLLMGILFVLGLAIGPLADRLLALKPRVPLGICPDLNIHEEELRPWLAGREIWHQLRHCSLPRGVLILGLAIFVFLLVTGGLGSPEWGWEKITWLVVCSAGLFIIATVSDHFLEEHLWNHIAKRHLLRIFLWTLGALLLIEFGKGYLNIEAWLKESPLVVILAACLVGIIPESGPHLIFVMLFANGTVPFSVLLASSIVQDGHGMLPLLAYSIRDFLQIKAINFAVGLGAGLLVHFAGW